MSEFFKDHTGKLSLMRLMSFVSLITSIYFGILAIKMDSQIGLYLVSTLITGAFAPKAVQKYIELSDYGIAQKKKD